MEEITERERMTILLSSDVNDALTAARKEIAAVKDTIKINEQTISDFNELLIRITRSNDPVKEQAMVTKELETFEDLLGKTLSAVEVNSAMDELVFTLDNGEQYMLYHAQDCCENVSIEDICGDLSDLVGSPILMADEASSDENLLGVEMDYQDSFTWTFYKLATLKGYVTIRWYGESNGYYSERVDWCKV